ncbi:unannotated protein [freshwater metagenome]|uniref:Unannotated protein n=1 Tax=freshwater metagenome TaxID=449393 RepID=A0A6J7IF18_9ZZZZ
MGLGEVGAGVGLALEEGEPVGDTELEVDVEVGLDPLDPHAASTNAEPRTTTPIAIGRNMRPPHESASDYAAECAFCCTTLRWRLRRHR